MTINTQKFYCSIKKITTVFYILLFLTILNGCDNKKENTAPVANAGADQSVKMGDTVTLDGSASSDMDGDVLSFEWTFITRPSGSSASFTETGAITPTFIADVEGQFVIELKVVDADTESTDTVQINVEVNSIPVANAGPNQSGQPGNTVTLDGSASSDVDGDSLSYQWSLSTPNNSSASLNDSSSVNPEFIADQSGQYQAELTVNDGVIDSPSDTVLINIVTPNTLPVANAGADQSGFTGDLVQLDGSQSTDADGDALNYQWSLIAMPENSSATLIDSTSVMASFTADIAGQYVVQLIVNDGIDDSTPDAATINIQIANTIPVANAGPDQNAFVGDTIFLDGNNSVDVDNDPLSFLWSLISQPSDSSSILDNNQTATPSLDIDKPGQYIAQLIVNDGQANSAADEVIITTENTRPVADAGTEQTINVGELIQLDGSLSSDVDGDNLSYQWSITSQPTDSVAILSDVTIVNPQLTSDQIGSYVFQLIVSDGVLDSAADTVTVQVLAIASLVLQVTNPPTGLLTNQKSLTLMGNVNEAASVSLNGESITVEVDLTFSKTVTLTEGENSFNFVASSAAGGTSSVSIIAILDSVVPEPVNIGFVSVSEPGVANAVEITGASGSAEPGSEVTITNSRTGEMITLTVAADGSFSGTMIGIAGDTYTIIVSDAVGNKSKKAATNDGSLPMDPAIVAPELNPSGNTSLINSTNFLYTGFNPIQTGVIEGTIEAKRVAIVRGEVLDDNNNPLSGVTVQIKDHTEFGQTFSRSDGVFDMVVNGGGLLTINYTKEGYLPVQRKILTTWTDYIRAETIIMIPLDSQATVIDLTDTSQPFQVAQGSVQTDDDGSRQATILFPQGTTASIVLADGTTQPLSNLTFRATEYTVGSNGPQRMPGSLPPSSGYTYAVELSVDEAISAGADTVIFNQKVPFYVDNFLDFPVGEVVPIGYYDRNKAAWIPSENGKVIKIVSVTDGVADIDVTGDDVADTGAVLINLGITLEEQAQLGTIYSAGKSLWRTEIEHLTPWDCNWPFGPPDDAEPPIDEEPLTNDDEKPKDPCEESGCIIQVESQVLGEDFSITGSELSLHYRSNRVSGRIVDRTITIPLSGDSIPASTLGIKLIIQVAGQVFVEKFPPQTNLTKTFVWNGLDSLGREISQIDARIIIEYSYPLQYYRSPSEFRSSFAVPTLELRRIGRNRRTSRAITKRVWSVELSKKGLSNDSIGGLTISNHHTLYDNVNSSDITLVLGDGSEYTISSESFGLESVLPFDEIDHKDAQVLSFQIDSQGSIYALIDGTSFTPITIWKFPTNGEPIKILTSNDLGVTLFDNLGGEQLIEHPKQGAVGQGELGPFTLDKNDNIYFTAKNNPSKVGAYIYRLSSKGILTLVAGTGETNRPIEDNVVAINTNINVPRYLAVDNFGDIYYSGIYDEETVSHKIFKISASTGILSTFAGTKNRGATGDGGLATNAMIKRPFSVVFDSQNNLYFAGDSFYDGGSTEVRKISPTGIISTVVINDELERFGYLALDAEDNLYVNSLGGSSFNGKVYLIKADGDFKHVFGLGQDSNLSESVIEELEKNSLPVNSTLLSSQMIFSPSRKLYFHAAKGFRSNGYVISLKTIKGSLTNKIVYSREGDESYLFDLSTGQHLETIDNLTNQKLYSFTYETNDILSTIIDRNDDVTTIERMVDGTPLAIVAPDGQRTEINLDENGYAKTLTNPAGDTHKMTYLEGGLLDIYTDPNGNDYDYDYDADGRLIDDKSPTGAGWELAITDQISNSRTVTKTSKEGHKTRYLSATLATDDFQRTITNPDGTQAIVLEKKNGETITIRANGTVNSFTEGPDPRFGMSAPIIEKGKITLPGGLFSEFSKSRSVVLSDPDDVLSLSQLTNVTTTNGNVSTSVFDVSTLTRIETSAENRTSSIQLNSKGEPVITQKTGLNQTSYSYDVRGRLNRLIVGSGVDERVTILDYYPPLSPMAGYLKSITDAEEHETSFEYDANGRVNKQILPDAREIVTNYDANGNITGTVPAGRPLHVFSYNGINMKVQYSPPLVGGITTPQTSFTYNKDKMPMQVTFPDGRLIEYQYSSTSGKLDKITSPRGEYNYVYNDLTGQLEGVSAPGTTSLTFIYDGALLKSTDWGSLVYEDGALLPSLISGGLVLGKVSSNYNSDFQISSQSINTGNQIDFIFDKDGLLTQAGDLVISREAQKSGLEKGTILGNLTTTQNFTGFAEVESFDAFYDASSMYRVNYIRDKLGRIKKKTETISGVTTITDYEYDVVGRLKSETASGTTTYSYDNNNNRTQINGSVVGLYDAQDRLISFAGASYQYSDNGDLESKIEAGQTTNYNYDVYGNLLAVSFQDGTSVEYIIDAQKRRIGKKMDGTLVQGFLYQDQLNPIAELDGSNQIVSQFVYATKSNVPDYMIKGGITYRIISDQLGSPRLVINVTTGVIAQQVDYDTWGNIISDSNPGFQPFGFAGGIYDQETQLTRYGARDYDAWTGRWTTKDPIRFKGGSTNFYSYVNNDPINYIDPKGEIPKGVKRFLQTVVLVAASIVANKPIGISVIDAMNRKKWTELIRKQKKDNKRNKDQGGFADPDLLLTMSIPWFLTPSELGCDFNDCNSDNIDDDTGQPVERPPYFMQPCK